MKAVADCFSRDVRLTNERLAHILDRAEMAGMEEAMVQTLQAPLEVRVSRSDANVRLFYEFYSGPWAATSGCASW